MRVEGLGMLVCRRFRQFGPLPNFAADAVVDLVVAPEVLRSISRAQML